ncbi:MAG: ribonuclease domain-containing protein [Micromonosporaceae bacterium]
MDAWRRAIGRTSVALLLAVCAALSVAGCDIAPPSTAAPSTAPSTAGTPRSELPEVPVAELPAEAREVLDTIERGGPYDYPQDDGVFGNREGLLPDRYRGYYREYTVPTPGESDRGARRLVAGAGGDVYYTADHYRSFRQVRL